MEYINTTIILECKGSSYPVLLYEEQIVDKATISNLSPSKCLDGYYSNVGGSLESIADCIGHEKGEPTKVWSKVVVNDGGRGMVEDEPAQNISRMIDGDDLETRQIRCLVESTESEDVANIQLAKVTGTWNEVGTVVEETNNVMGNSNEEATRVQVLSMKGAAEFVFPYLTINGQKQAIENDVITPSVLKSLSGTEADRPGIHLVVNVEEAHVGGPLDRPIISNFGEGSVLDHKSVEAQNHGGLWLGPTSSIVGTVDVRMVGLGQEKKRRVREK
ncbi:hypothetical protein CsSME_00053555 [Camellia sinensis var. sinensis]